MKKTEKADRQADLENDIELAFTEAGSPQNPTLILLHGNEESRHCFHQQIDAFSKDFHVLAVDTRGHGDSPRGEKPFSLYQFARDLNHFMELHSIPSAHLLGFSDGANIAMIFALKNPDRTDSLVLCGGNLFPQGVREELVREMKEEYEELKKNPDSKSKRDFLSLMLFEPSIRPEKLNHLQIPSLVVAGSEDCIREEHTRLIADSLPDSSLHIIRGNHFIPYEKASAFNQTVLDFYHDRHII